MDNVSLGLLHFIDSALTNAIVTYDIKIPTINERLYPLIIAQ